jgi:hypothetical protein
MGLAAAGRRLLVWVVVVASVFFAARVQAADPKAEKEAQALQKKAIDEDFLNLDYAAAIKKLQSAINKCGADRCSPAVKGALLRDLGAMQVLAGNEAEGRASFGQALAAHGALELDPAYKNPQLEAVWAEAKKKKPAAGGAAEPARGGQPTGDFAHTPPTEALERTPLSIFVEYTASEKLARVIAKYKSASMSDWKSLELQKIETGYGGQIPCKDVAVGTMSYYVQGFNAANDPVANSGSRNTPYTVPVKTEISGAPAALPGHDPPKQCGELAGAECPPDFPGCNNKKAAGEDCEKDRECTTNLCVGGKCAEKKGGGDECSKDDECASHSCSDGKCTEAKKGDGADCEKDDECDSDSCKEGKCSGGGAGGFRRIWIGLAVGLDLYFMPGATNVCRISDPTPPMPATGPIVANPQGYQCADPSSGAAYPGADRGPQTRGFNAAIVPDKGDQVQGGVAHGPLTIMASFDYAVSANMLVGLRVGYELFTDPLTTRAFAPVHAEARFTYLIGSDAILKKVAPMVFGGAGVGTFDAFVPVNVFATNSTTNPFSENAWNTAGPAFVTGGGGIRLGLSKTAAATGAIKLQGAFGGAAGFLFGFVPEVGVQLGF